MYTHLHLGNIKYLTFLSLQNIILVCPNLKFLKLINKEIYSNKKETSNFHGTVSFDPVKMSQQK